MYERIEFTFSSNCLRDEERTCIFLQSQYFKFIQIFTIYLAKLGITNFSPMPLD